MEMKPALSKVLRSLFLVMALIFNSGLQAQITKSYAIRNGKMYITLSKSITERSLDSFIVQFDLFDLGLKQLIRTGFGDSLKMQGWSIDLSNNSGFVVSKSMEPADNLRDPASKILLTEKHDEMAARFPSVSSNIIYGFNRFNKKSPFRIIDSLVVFQLRGFGNARSVQLAGSFNAWKPDAQAMKRTDSGWIAAVRLRPGKYWYKFIVDGSWIVDPENDARENDGEGNINSVYFKTNVVFSLQVLGDAKNVFLAGSFNNWNPKSLKMIKAGDHYELPVYLANGTHTYKFVVDGKWYTDEANPVRFPDGGGGYNSVITLGSKHLFKLSGYPRAGSVFVAGSFNGWRPSELPLQRKGDDWELNYAVGPGNYEYKFIVDGQWISDPANPLHAYRDGNSFLIVQPNYTFTLKGFENAKRVSVAGDFNDWNPDAFPMKKENGEWKFALNLPPGKTRYKFVVDGRWIIDPNNKLWEQNEFNTGNSIIWIRD